MVHPTGVFISYGRADDESFAKRLAHDLPRVWWDREAMENRGRTFLQEIRDAIAESERLVLVLGAMLRGRPGRWANALHKLHEADLDRIRREFPNYPYPSLLRSIKVSVDALAPEAHARYLDLAIFPDGTSVPLSVLARLWGLESFDTEDVVDALVDRSLARTEEDGALTLHDLQRDYVRQHVGDLSTIHQRLLDAYATDCPNWARGANDGYFFENLAHHLIGAGHRDELVRLLTRSPEWLEAKFVSCQGDGPFLADVQLALATGSELLVEFVGLRCLKQVVGERTSLYTDVDLMTLVSLGREDEARAHARLRDSEADRFQGLRVIYDSVEDPVELLDALHDTAQAIRDEEERTWALCDLASRLHRAGDSRLEDILQEAQRLAEAHVVPGTQADLFRRLGAILIEVGRPDEAIALVETISHFWSFAPALYELGRILERRGDERAATVLKDARRKASKMHVDGSKTHDLGKLAVALAQSGCIEKAQSMIADLPKHAYSEKRDALHALAGALAEEGRFDEAIDAARAAGVHRTEQVLAMMVEAGRLDEAEKHVRKLRSRAISPLIKLAIARVANHDDERADALFGSAAKLARSTEDERGYDLHNLAKGLADAGRLDQAEAAAREIAAPWKRAEALRDLALVLAKSGDARARSIFEEVREAARSTERTGPRSDALRALAMLFASSGDFATALKLARRVPIAQVRAGALRDLIRSMHEAGDPQADEVSEEARASAQAVDPHGRLRGAASARTGGARSRPESCRRNARCRCVRRCARGGARHQLSDPSVRGALAPRATPRRDRRRPSRRSSRGGLGID